MPLSARGEMRPWKCLWMSRVAGDYFVKYVKNSIAVDHRLRERVHVTSYCACWACYCVRCCACTTAKLSSVDADSTLVSAQICGEEHSILQHQGYGKVYVSLGRGPELASSHGHTKFGYKHCGCLSRGEGCTVAVVAIEPRYAQWGTAGPATAAGTLSVCCVAFLLFCCCVRLHALGLYVARARERRDATLLVGGHRFGCGVYAPEYTWISERRHMIYSKQLLFVPQFVPQCGSQFCSQQCECAAWPSPGS